MPDTRAAAGHKYEPKIIGVPAINSWPPPEDSLSKHLDSFNPVSISALSHASQYRFFYDATID